MLLPAVPCTDPLKADGTPVTIHYKVPAKQNSKQKLARWRCIRGTNAVETYHSHFHKLLPGGNNSPAHAHNMFMIFNGR
jgi:hypothetical protein